jgi:hypothetical protein
MINETLFHDEFAIYRAVTGGAYNIPGMYGRIIRGGSFPAKGSIPIATHHYGLITSTGTAVRGVGTQFSLLNPGDFLYHKDVVRQIDYIVSDTLLFLKQGFPTDISVGETPMICNRQTFKRVIIKNAHATNAATVQEAALTPSEQTIITGGAPFSFDAGTGVLSFTVHE